MWTIKSILMMPVVGIYELTKVIVIHIMAMVVFTYFVGKYGLNNAPDRIDKWSQELSDRTRKKLDADKKHVRKEGK